MHNMDIGGRMRKGHAPADRPDRGGKQRLTNLFAAKRLTATFCASQLFSPLHAPLYWCGIIATIPFGSGSWLSADGWAIAGNSLTPCAVAVGAAVRPRLPSALFAHG